MKDMGAVSHRALPPLEHAWFGDKSLVGDLQGLPYAMLSSLEHIIFGIFTLYFPLINEFHRVRRLMWIYYNI